MSEIQETPRRGRSLTAIIATLAILQIIVITFLVGLWLDRAAHNRPDQGFLLLAIALTTVALAGLVGIWRLRLWGVYLVGALMVIDLISCFFIGVQALTLFIRLTLLIILCTAIGRRWESFH